MADVLDWQRAPDPRQVVDRAVQELRDGRLVGFPTETVYGVAASGLLPDAVERLVQCKGRPENKPLTVAIGGAAAALDWLPGASQLARRLMRRCWPGPVTIVGGDGLAEGLAERLSETVRRWVCPSGRLGLRVPAHETILQVLYRLAGPVLLTSANRSGETEAATPEEVIQAVGDHLALLIADGRSRFGKASTVIQIEGNNWKVLREGVVPSATLERLSSCIIVFVCTGNTCRSPLAEVLCKSMLAERLGCRPEELVQRGFSVHSAGIAAMMGGRATGEALEAARELGADLADHVSRPLSRELAVQADYLVAMTQGHLDALKQHFPRLGCRPRLLCPNGADILDPIGGEQQVYRECANQISESLKQFLPEVQG